MTPDECCRAYFAALTQKDWSALADIVTDDVVYGLRPAAPLPQYVSGKEAFLAMTREVFAHFDDARFENIRVSPLAMAVKMFVAEYDGSWRGHDGTVRQERGRVVFEVRNSHIARITVLLDDSSLELVAQDLMARRGS